MKQEIVDEVIKEMSGGNVNLKIVLKEVYCVGKDKINKWDDSEVPRLRNVLGVGSTLLLGKRLSFAEIAKDPKKFWRSKQGQTENKLLRDYIVPRLIKGAKKNNL